MRVIIMTTICIDTDDDIDMDDVYIDDINNNNEADDNDHNSFKFCVKVSHYSVIKTVNVILLIYNLHYFYCYFMIIMIL